MSDNTEIMFNTNLLMFNISEIVLNTNFAITYTGKTSDIIKNLRLL